MEATTEANGGKDEDLSVTSTSTDNNHGISNLNEHVEETNSTVTEYRNPGIPADPGHSGGGDMENGDVSNDQDLQSFKGDNNSKFICAVCDKAFSTKAQRARHLFTHTRETPHACNVCTKMFRDKFELKQHMLIVHEGILPHVCEICRKGFTRRCMLRKHMKKHIDWVYRCNLCCVNFRNIREVIAHDKQHKAKMVHKCTICNKTFAAVKILERHIEKVHSANGKRAKPTKVSIGTRKSTRNSNKTMNYQVYDDLDDKLSCSDDDSHGPSVISEDDCDVLSSVNLSETDGCQVSSITKRQRTNNSTKQSILDDVSSYEKSSLQNDSILPISNRNEDSVLLNMSVTDDGALNGKTPGLYPCTICGREFKGAGGLKRHQTTSHAKPHQCLVCNQSFKKSADLKRHETKHAKGIDVINESKGNLVVSKFETEKIGECEEVVKHIADIGCQMESIGNIHLGLNVKEERLDENDDYTTQGEMIENADSSNMDDTLHSDAVGNDDTMEDADDDVLNNESTDQTEFTNILPSIGLMDFKTDAKEMDSTKPMQNGEMCASENFLNNPTVAPCTLDTPSQQADNSSPKEMPKLNSSVDSNPEDTLFDTAFTCPKCNKQCLNNLSFQRHMRCHTSKFQCNKCLKRFRDGSDLKRHLVVHNMNRKPEEKMECHICSNIYYGVQALKRHQRSHFKHYQCSECKKYFRDEGDLRRHSQVHNKVGLAVLTCEQCEKQCLGVDALKRHLRSHQKKFQCEPCNKYFRDRVELKRHLGNMKHSKKIAELGIDESTLTFEVRNNTSYDAENSNMTQTPNSSIVNSNIQENPIENDALQAKDSLPFDDKVDLEENLPKLQKANFNLPKMKKKQYVVKNIDETHNLCERCGKCYSSKAHLLRHVRRHGDAMFKCSLCSKRYHDKCDLKRHVETHTEELNYICSTCSKGFTTMDYLKKHEKIHRIHRPYKCKLCPATFKVPESLRSHTLSIHENVRKYACDYCNKRFNKSSTMIKHRRIHTGEKPFECDICSRRFIQKGDMLKHRMTHTGEKPHKCVICLKGFIQKGTLKDHMKCHNLM